MPITDAIHKADRLEEIKILFLRRPAGVGTREIAQLLRVSQRTARRYVLELSDKGRLPVYREGRVWKLVEGGQIDLRRIQLNLDEALALYLAARMLSAYSDKHNPHVVASLLKLAAALPEAIGAHIERTAEGGFAKATCAGVSERLGRVDSGLGRRRVRLSYRDPISGERSERLFDPFFIEPSFVGYACYVLGFDHSRQAICIFKVERLERVEVLDSSYEMPPDFDPYDYLKFAWGIMGGDEVVEVKLRFSEKVALSSAGVGLAGSGEAGGRQGRAVYADFFGQPRFGNEALD